MSEETTSMSDMSNLPRELCKRLNHIAVAVPDASAAAALYGDAFGAEVSTPQDVPAHGVTVVFARMPGATLEFMQPLGDESPIAKFLAKRPSGGLHHLCYEVDDIYEAQKRLCAAGIRGIGDVAEGAHGNPVLFLHPRDCGGVLIELEQVEEA